MKILSIGNFGFGWDGSICDEEHIAAALERADCDVIRCQRGEPVPAGGYTCVLIAQWDGYTDGFLAAVRLLHVPIVYWAFDYQAHDQPWHRKLIAMADLYLSKRLADNIFPNWQWFSQDFAPPFLDAAPPVSKDIDVLFTGSYLPWATERTTVLKAVDAQFNLTIHSFTPEAWQAEGFKRVYGPVMDTDLPALIARARINLSIDHTIEAGYWSDRNAQIMACGGLVLFRYVPLSRSIFKGHITYFSGTGNCIYRLHQLFERPEEDLATVAEGGYTYAQEYMMVDNRARDLLVIMQSIE